MQGRRGRRIALLAAGLLLAAALCWNLLLNQHGAGAYLAQLLQTDYGYTLYASDFQAVDSWQNTSIRALLPETDLLPAIEASNLVGLPADVDRLGAVELIMANTEENHIVTLFFLDGELELGFEQKDDEVYPLGYSAPQ